MVINRNILSHVMKLGSNVTEEEFTSVSDQYRLRT